MEKVDDLPEDSPLFQALHAVMIMLQKPKDQPSVSKEIGQPSQLIDQLRNIDKENIPTEVIKELIEYVKEIGPKFDEIK